MRRPLEFICESDTLFATLDAAPGDTGLLIVSGGNEIRSGAWAGQAQLAARVAAAGKPVFRYDRRGVGDSGGVNRGYLESSRTSPPPSPRSAPLRRACAAWSHSAIATRPVR